MVSPLFNIEGPNGVSFTKEPQPLTSIRKHCMQKGRPGFLFVIDFNRFIIPRSPSTLSRNKSNRPAEVFPDQRETW